MWMTWSSSGFNIQHRNTLYWWNAMCIATVVRNTFYLHFSFLSQFFVFFLFFLFTHFSFWYLFKLLQTVSFMIEALWALQTAPHILYSVIVLIHPFITFWKWLLFTLVRNCSSMRERERDYFSLSFCRR